jgi:putative photosynthetic complex assembly protein 2
MQPLTFFGPVFFAIFLWWFTTGLIIAVYGRSPRLVSICFGGATVALFAAMWGLVATRPFTQPLHIYIAFSCGLVIWGWQTASYYLGYVTGPRSQQAAADVTDLSIQDDVVYRFRLAFRAGVYHELLVVLFVLLLVGLTWSSANQWGLWIFVAMWIMHSSAKLNVFLGVRNFRIELLPSHLHHLDGLLNKQPSNAFFPVSVVAASTVSLFMFYQAIIPRTAPSQAIGYLLVATMIGLGVIEHLLLVMPIPATLYGWGIRRLPSTAVTENTPRQKNAPLRAMPKQMIEG